MIPGPRCPPTNTARVSAYVTAGTAHRHGKGVAWRPAPGLPARAGPTRRRSRTARRRAPRILPCSEGRAPRGLAVSAVGAAGDWDLRAAGRVVQRLKTWRADIVHAHDARAHAIALAALVGRRRIPLIVTRRVAIVPRGRIKYGTRVAQFIAISHAVRDALVAGGVDPSRIDVVHSGVPTPLAPHPRNWRRECGWPLNSTVCGVVGAMTVEKGIGLLDEIARRMPDEQRRSTRLVLLGGASAGLTTIGGIPAIRAGFVDEVHPAMAGLDVLWHPASSEGLGTAVIDAMALRVPPIAFRVGGLPELIVDRVTGLLVPPADVQAFATAASMLVTDRELRRRLGSAGPERGRNVLPSRRWPRVRRVSTSKCFAGGRFGTPPPARGAFISGKQHPVTSNQQLAISPSVSNQNRSGHKRCIP
jgi:glycosyltransferase involved in cell wall biosynthesis